MSATPSPTTARPLHDRAATVRGFRTAIIRSNVPPLSWGYAAAYDLVEALALKHLVRRFGDALAAVYLRGSRTMDVCVPALSDLDLTFVLHDDVESGELERLREYWSRVARRVPLLEADPWSLRRADFVRLGSENPGVRFRLMEAQSAWRLLHGADVLRGLDTFSDAERRQALVDDLETRLTYFNGLVFEPHRNDGLQRRRYEYLAYKLVLDLARTLGFQAGAPLPGRGAVARSFLAGESPVEASLGVGDDRELRRFVEFACRHRLRRSFFAGPSAGWEFGARLLDLTIRTLQVSYRDPGLRTLPEVMAQAGYFYEGDRFLPTGNPVRRQVWPAPTEFAALRDDVLAARARGTHTVLEAEGLRVNLGNTSPALANCTVVPVDAH